MLAETTTLLAEAAACDPGGATATVLAWATVALVVITGVYVVLTFCIVRQMRRQADTMETQAKEMTAREQRRDVQAVRAILAELRVNAFAAVECRQRGPFLADAYPAGLAALAAAHASADTLAKLADAHVSVIRFNSAHATRHQAAGGDPEAFTKKAWETAGTNITAAYERAKADEALMAYVDWPGYATPIPPIN